MAARDLIVLLDCGDTIIDEGTQVFDASGAVVAGDVIPGSDRMVRDLAEHGFRIALVADGRRDSFEKLLHQHGIRDCFETLTCSDIVGEEKPGARMFQAALASLGLTETGATRCVMVGNNLARDIAGAKGQGITSIHLAWTDRYPKDPAKPDEVPDHTIATPASLLPLLLRWEAEHG